MDAHLSNQGEQSSERNQLNKHHGDDDHHHRHHQHRHHPDDHPNHDGYFGANSNA